MRKLHRHSRVLAVVCTLMGFWGSAVQADEPGSWVNQVPVGRGYFAQVEALWLKRDASDAATLATLNSPGTNGRPGVLASEDVSFDFEPGVRFLAGMELNHCTQVEVEYFGISSFQGNQAALVRPPGPGVFALNSVYTLINQSALAYRASGETELHNGELNIRRSGGNGHFTNSVLVGLRYMHIRDALKIDAVGQRPIAIPQGPPIPAPPVIAPGALAFESTSADTRNNIFGVQLGGDVGYHWNYLHITASAEGILYANFYDTDARNVITDPSMFFLGGTSSFRDSRDEDTDATIGVGAQVGLDASICLTDSIILHGGYHVLALSDLALGSEQLPEVRTSPARGARITNPDRSQELGSLFFHGPSAGLEIRW